MSSLSDPLSAASRLTSGGLSPVALASLLASRLCHDLLSPVGALGNGVELLVDETDPAMRDQCIALLEQGARSASGKLRFFRLAFGAAGGRDEEIALAELRELVGLIAAEARGISVDWSVGVASLPKPAVKVLLNLALIAIEALPRGGSVAIAAEEVDGASEIALRAEGPRLVFDPQIGRALEGGLPAGEITARTAPAEFIRTIAAESGGTLQFAQAEGTLVLGAVLPRG